MTDNTLSIRHFSHPKPSRWQQIFDVLVFILLLCLPKLTGSWWWAILWFPALFQYLVKYRQCAWQWKQEDSYPAIDADKDGLWLAKRGKAAGLVCWSDAIGLRERWGMLEVLDAQGNRLISISRHLIGMEWLAERLFLAIPADENARAERYFGDVIPQTDKQHFRNIWTCVAQALNKFWVPAFILWFFFWQDSLEIVYLYLLVLTIVVLHKFVITDYGIDITPDGITIHTLLRRRRLRWTDIVSIHLAPAKPSGGSGYPTIQLLLSRSIPDSWIDTLFDQLSAKLSSEPQPRSNQLVELHCGGRMPAALFQALHRGWEPHAATAAATDNTTSTNDPLIQDWTLPSTSAVLACRLDRSPYALVSLALPALVFLLIAFVCAWESFLASLIIIGALTLGLRRHQRNLPRRFSNIDCDDEGLWPAGQNRDTSLIRWADIARWQQKRPSQPLILYRADGQELLRLSPWLSHYALLYQRLIERTAQPVALPYVWRRPKDYRHPLFIGVLGVILTGATVCLLHVDPVFWLLVVIVGFFSLMIFVICQAQPLRITIDEKSVTLHYLLRRNVSYPRQLMSCVVGYSLAGGYDLTLYDCGKPVFNMHYCTTVTLALYAQMNGALRNDTSA